MTSKRGENLPVIEEYHHVTAGSVLRLDEQIPRIDVMSSGGPTTAHLLLGKSLFQAGRYELALGELEAALRENPEMGMAHFIKGLIFTFRAQFEDAVVSLEYATVLEKDEFGPLMALGFALSEIGEYERALTSVDRALKLNPKLPNAHFLRGNVLALLKRFPEAIKAYKKALSLNPQLTTARYKLGYLLAESGQSEEAIRELALGLSLVPPNLNAQIALGDLLHRAGRPDDAIQRYKVAVELFPWEALPYSRLAELYFEIGWKSEAIFMARVALRIDPKKVVSAVIVGRIYMEQKLYSEALEMFQAAVNVDSRFPEALLWLEKAKTAVHSGWGNLPTAPTPAPATAGHTPNMQKETLARRFRELEQGILQLAKRLPPEPKSPGNVSRS